MHAIDEQTKLSYGRQRSDEVRDRIVREISRLDQRQFNLVVEGQLADGHQNGSAGRRGSPAEQPADALLPVHSHAAIDRVFIAARRKEPSLTILNIYISSIGRVTFFAVRLVA